jgi:hypothetical protein
VSAAKGRPGALGAGTDSAAALLTNYASCVALTAIENITLQVNAAAIADRLASIAIAGKNAYASRANLARWANLTAGAAIGRVAGSIYTLPGAKRRAGTLRARAGPVDALLGTCAGDRASTAMGRVLQKVNAGSAAIRLSCATGRGASPV